MSAGAPRLYSIHGLLLESDVPLDSAVSPDGAVEASVGEPLRYRVRLGEPRNCPYSPPAGHVVFEQRNGPLGYWVAQASGDAERWTVRIADHMDFMLDRPRRLVTLHPALGVDEGIVPILLGGMVLAHVLIAEGRVMLHASAVALGDRVLAIAGPSGGGKSTIAAMLCGVGARLMTDDALRIEVVGGRAVCYPGTRTIRLRETAADVGATIAEARLGVTADGRTSLVPPRLASGPAPLEAVLIPQPSHEARELVLRRLGGVDALLGLLSNPRAGGAFVPGGRARVFEVMADVANAVPVFEATVPWGPPFAPGLAEELLGLVGLGLPGRDARTDRVA